MVATVAEELAAKEHKRKLAEAAAEEGVPRNAPPQKPAVARVFSAKDLQGMKFDEAPKKGKPGRPARHK